MIVSADAWLDTVRACDPGAAAAYAATAAASAAEAAAGAADACQDAASANACANLPSVFDMINSCQQS